MNPQRQARVRVLIRQGICALKAADVPNPGDEWVRTSLTSAADRIHEALDVLAQEDA